MGYGGGKLQTPKIQRSTKIRIPNGFVTASLQLRHSTVTAAAQGSVADSGSNRKPTRRNGQHYETKSIKSDFSGCRDSSRTCIAHGSSARRHTAFHDGKS